MLPSYNYNFRTAKVFNIHHLKKLRLPTTLFSILKLPSYFNFSCLGPLPPKTHSSREDSKTISKYQKLSRKEWAAEFIEWNIGGKNNYDSCIFFQMKNMKLFSENLSLFWFSLWQLNVCAEESILALPGSVTSGSGITSLSFTSSKDCAKITIFFSLGLSVGIQ